VWEPYTGTSHRLPKPVSKKQLDNRVTNMGTSHTRKGVLRSFLTDSVLELYGHRLYHIKVGIMGIMLRISESQ
jgi:hypothetical protein